METLQTCPSLHRLEKPRPLYSPLPSVPGGGRPHVAQIQSRGWLAATMVEQGLFIDSGAEPPPAVGVPGPPPVVPGPGGHCQFPEPWDLAPVGTHTLTYIPLPSPHTHLEPPLGLGPWRQQLLHQAVLGCCQRIHRSDPPDPDCTLGPQIGSGRQGSCVLRD